MNTARQITFDARNNSESESFKPKGPFLIQAVGTVTSGVTFTIEQTPVQIGDNSTDWTTATGTSTTFDGTSATASINYVYGFKYRIRRSAGTQTDDITFYTGHVPSVDFVNVTNDIKSA